MDIPSLLVFIGEDALLASDLARAVRQSTGDFLCVLSPNALEHVEVDVLTALFLECRAVNRDRSLTLVTKNEPVRLLALNQGWNTIHTIKDIRALLKGHPSLPEALRVFSPVLYKRRAFFLCQLFVSFFFLVLALECSFFRFLHFCHRVPSLFLLIRKLVILRRMCTLFLLVRLFQLSVIRCALFRLLSSLHRLTNLSHLIKSVKNLQGQMHK
jgi:hypothetical protein